MLPSRRGVLMRRPELPQTGVTMAKSSANSAQNNLLKVSAELAQRYGHYKPLEKDDFIACLALQILELGNSERSARDALKRIREEYVDWNDMRAATVRELQDILGPRFVRCREKAEDLHSLLADIYTAFRRMDVTDLVVTPDGIATLRALPDTTLIRGDMVETALLTVCNVPTFPCDEVQFELLKYLGGVPKTWSFDTHLEKICELLDHEQILDLSHGLRQHVDFLHQQEIDDPKPVAYGWEEAKGSTKKTTAKKAASTKAETKTDKKAMTKAAPSKKQGSAQTKPKAAAKSSTKTTSKKPAAQKTTTKKTSKKTAE